MLEFSSLDACSTDGNSSSPLVGFSSNDTSCDGNVALLNDFESSGGCSNQGAQGPEGFSAYQIAVFNGFVGTEEEWLASLQGEPGEGVPPGGIAGQILAKIDDTSYNTEWIDNPDLAGYVPYTGATQDLNLGEFGTQLGNIEFDNTPTNTPTGSGSMYWNDQDGTANLILKGGNVTLQVGQEQVLRVVNKTITNVPLLEANYQAVRVTGAQGQRLKVDLAQATTDNLSAETIGLVTETIANNQEGFITTSGLVRGINTTGSLQGETWIDGEILYLSPFTAGFVTKVKPIAPNHLVIIGYVVHAHITQGTIFVKVDNGYELDELHNVKITEPVANNNVLAYTSAMSIWENKTIDSVIGYTPFNFPSLTSGSVLFSNGTTIAQDNTNFFWDNVNKKLGIGTSTFVGTNKLTVNGRIGGPTYSATYVDLTGNSAELRGNSGINYFSSVGNHIFYGGSSVEYMRLTTAGNLGIGEASPLTTLDIRTSSNTTITPLSSVPNIATTVLIGNTGTNGVLAIGHNNTGQPWLQGRSRLANAAAEDILINPLGGNVGIGTQTPSAKLHIVNTGQFLFNTNNLQISSAGFSSFLYNNAINWSSALTFTLQRQGGAIGLHINSSDNVGIGTITPTARLQVKGDGTNAIAVFENNVGTSGLSVNNSGSAIGLGSGGINIIITGDGSTNANNGTGLIYKSNVSSSNTTIYSHYFNNNNIRQAISGIIGLVDYNASFAAPAGSAWFRPINIAYTINNSGAQTGTATGIFLNATETALNGMAHNLIDLQVGGASQFLLTRDGRVVLKTGGVLSTAGNNLNFRTNLGGGSGYNMDLASYNNFNGTSGTQGFATLGGSFGAAVGAATFKPLNIEYTINNSGAQTGTATGIFLNATETALNGMVHNLMDLQVGGASKASITNNGQLIIDRSFGIKFQLSSVISAPSNGTLVFQNNAGTDFTRIMLGGTTNAFPSIKRNGSAIDFRLADDSGYANINAGTGAFIGSLSSSQGTGVLSGTVNAITSILSIVSPAGSGLFRLFNTTYTINASGAQTGNTTGYFLNATETNLNGMTHNLMDLQVGGVSKFKVSNIGTTTLTGILYIGNQLAFGGGASAQIVTSTSNNLTFRDSAGTGFNLVQLGGTTNLFPAIKRNGAQIDFRLADDSGFCGINTGNIVSDGSISSTSVLTGQSLISSGLIVNNNSGGTVNDNFIVKSLLLPSLFYVDAVNNKIGINTSTPSQILDVNGTIQSTQFKLAALNTAPATAASTGTLGEIRIDASFIYICTATNTWKRVGIATW